MKKAALKKLWLHEEKNAFQGWDFSHIQSRWQHAPLPWNYKLYIETNLRATDHLLDMGTGGGEFLLTLNHPYSKTAVTESWEPNIQLCLKRLAPLGISVSPVSKDVYLPVEDQSFDMVINRHASYNVREINRILKPNGLFITQQVGNQNCLRLEKKINLQVHKHRLFSLNSELPKFQQAGFKILQAKEAFPQLTFFDIGAIVFWAKLIPWSFPNFSVAHNFDQLYNLHQELEQDGCITDLEHRFILIAKKSADLHLF